MSLTVNKISSRRREDADGALIEEEWFVDPATNETIALSVPGLPVGGQRSGTDTRFAVTVREASLFEGSYQSWRVRVEYRPLIWQNPNEDEDDENLRGIEVNGEVAILSVWRLNNANSGAPALVFPQDQNPPESVNSPNGDSDIEGTPVDNAGEPIDHPITVWRLRLPVRFRGLPPLGILDAQSLTRNSKRFDIFKPGVVLMLPPQLTIEQPSGNTVGYFEFVVDPWYHMRQKAHYDAEAKVLRYGGTEGGGNYWAGRAAIVAWHQPFNATTDLSRLLRLRGG